MKLIYCGMMAHIDQDPDRPGPVSSFQIYEQAAGGYMGKGRTTLRGTTISKGRTITFEFTDLTPEQVFVELEKVRIGATKPDPIPF